MMASLELAVGDPRGNPGDPFDDDLDEEEDDDDDDFFDGDNEEEEDEDGPGDDFAALRGARTC